MVTVYRITLVCKGVPALVGPAAAHAITREFIDRSWHKQVTCAWDGSQLILQAENDFDSKGLALLDEFSAAISTCINDPFDRDLIVLSIRELKR